MKSEEIVPFKDRVASVRSMFQSRKKQMLALISKEMSVERLTILAFAAVQKTPKLMECTPVSFVNAVMQSGRLGLEPDGLLGEAYLVPFKKIVTLIPGYKGLLKLARNSGQIATIQAHEVYEKDTFAFNYGSEPSLSHMPTSEEYPGKIIGFYAVARLRDGSSQFEFMWKRQVDKIRDSSQGYQAAKKFDLSTPWDTHYEEMGKKTALRRLCKMLPASTQVQRAVAIDEQADAGMDQQFDIDITGEELEPQSAISKLDAIVDAAEGLMPGPPAKPLQEPPQTLPTEPKKISLDQAADLHDLVDAMKIPRAVLHEKLNSIGVKFFKDLPIEWHEGFIEWAKSWKPPMKNIESNPTLA